MTLHGFRSNPPERANIFLQDILSANLQFILWVQLLHFQLFRGIWFGSWMLPLAWVNVPQSSTLWSHCAPPDAGCHGMLAVSFAGNRIWLVLRENSSAHMKLLKKQASELFFSTTEMLCGRLLPCWGMLVLDISLESGLSEIMGTSVWLSNRSFD